MIRRKTRGPQQFRPRKERSMFQFVQWSFQKREENKQQLRKEHPSTPIVTKILEKFKTGKEPKDMMPMKTATRYIFNIYLKKANELSSGGSPKKKEKKEEKSVSPE